MKKLWEQKVESVPGCTMCAIGTRPQLYRKDNYYERKRTIKITRVEKDRRRYI